MRLPTIDRDTPINFLKSFGNLASKQIDLQLKCRYPTIVTTTEFPEEIEEIKSTDLTIAYGSFASNFDLQFYTDDSFEGRVSSFNFGDQVFSQVVFRHPTLFDKVKFIMADCKVSNGDTDIYVIKDNCYADFFEAGLISNSHINRRRSKFSYKSFAFNEDYDLFSIYKTS